MQPDLALVLGIILATFSIPSVISAMSDSRAPRASAVSILIAGGLILWALRTQPGGYTWPDIPEVFVRVLADFMN
ncbi:hypothetical protein E4Z66_07610 [Aliishimia ponticola]|uniref:50S ribosomal protein L35 n=1 Tax=Aliishimia ponticola TaxID=2499833 RepID=A0A4V3XKG3_9RHOB|nr:hypothetical protein [Aliishimia ponticola]THH36803.1 hypothetical protein E4Z66_07610 [Aliishimia ponticola]